MDLLTLLVIAAVSAGLWYFSRRLPHPWPYVALAVIAVVWLVMLLRVAGIDLGDGRI